MVLHHERIKLKSQRHNYENEAHCAWDAGDKIRAYDYMERVIVLDEQIKALDNQITWAQLGVKAA